MRLLVVGASATPVCGIRDFAATLTPALESAGAVVETVWWDRDARDGAARTRRAAAAWVERSLAAAGRADAVLWHYGCFSYGPRGLPVAVPRVARAFAAFPVPVVGFLHELAYPWHVRGWRGGVQAATQRVALQRVVSRIAGVVVTEEQRARWVTSRRWLPARPVLVVPVHSNVPATAASGRNGDATAAVGIFGFSAEAPAVEATAAAIAALRRDGVDVTMTMIGAPGPESWQAEQWRIAAADAQWSDGLTFTGVLPAHEVSRALADLDVVLLPDRGGPSSRRTTLAAALAHGKAVVAVDGPQRWHRAVQERAVVISPAEGEALADRLGELLRSPEARRAQEQRAREFYERAMAPELTARRLLAFVRELGAVGAAP